MTNFASSTFPFWQKNQTLPKMLIPFCVTSFEIFSTILEYLPYYACTKFQNKKGHDLLILSLCHMEDVQATLYASFSASFNPPTAKKETQQMETNTDEKKMNQSQQSYECLSILSSPEYHLCGRMYINL